MLSFLGSDELSRICSLETKDGRKENGDVHPGYEMSWKGLQT
jgi:hypothetical protein